MDFDRPISYKFRPHFFVYVLTGLGPGTPALWHRPIRTSAPGGSNFDLPGSVFGLWGRQQPMVDAREVLKLFWNGSGNGSEWLYPASCDWPGTARLSTAYPHAGMPSSNTIKI